MTRHMLDTHTVSQLIWGNAKVARRISAAPAPLVCISAIIEGELRFGLARRPEARRLHLAVREFLLRVEVLAWNSGAAERYGAVRAGLEAKGKPLASLDLLIAAHALSAGAVLVTADRAFAHVAGLQIEDWEA